MGIKVGIKDQTEKSINEMSQPTQSFDVGENVNEPYTNPDTGAKESFNASIHATNKDGEPILRKDGFYRRKPGRSKGDSTTGGSTIGIDPSVGMSAPTGEMQTLAAAKTVTTCIFMSGMLVFGEKGKPTPEEEQYNLYAWATYFAEKGIDDIPPSMMVIMASAMYALPRFLADKNARGKVKSFWDKLFPKKQTNEKGEKNESDSKVV